MLAKDLLKKALSIENHLKKFSICGIYMIYCLQTEMAYIGQSRNIRRGWSTHRRQLKDGKHPNEYLQRAFNKYGKDSFLYLVIDTTDSSKLNEFEELYLTGVNSESLYNLMALGVFPSSNLHIEKMSISHAGRKQTEESKLKISQTLKGFKRQPFTEEHRKKLSEAHKGKPGPKFSKEIIERIRKKNTGYKHTEEARKKMSESAKKRKKKSSSTDIVIS